MNWLADIGERLLNSERFRNALIGFAFGLTAAVFILMAHGCGGTTEDQTPWQEKTGQELIQDVRNDEVNAWRHWFAYRKTGVRLARAIGNHQEIADLNAITRQLIRKHPQGLDVIVDPGPTTEGDTQ